MTERSLIALIITALFIASGCGPRESEVPDDEPAVAEDYASCTNEAAGYSVAYPADWHTNPGDVMDACSLFDPEPITVQPATEIPMDIAVAIYVDPVAFEPAAEGSPGEVEQSRESIEIDGRRAVRREVIGTGEAFIPEDVRAYTYYVQLGESTLIATSYEVGEPDFETKRRALDEIMRSLTFNR